MFVREKRIRGYTYLYLVETVREGGRVKQRVVKNLGRKDTVSERGDLDRLARSAARHANHAMVLSAFDRGAVMRQLPLEKIPAAVLAATKECH